MLDEWLWLVIFGGVVSFLCSFAIGANDVANAFATSVGSKTLTLKSALIVASIFEFSGAFLMGANVTNTIRKGITKSSYFEDSPELFMLAMVSVLIGAGTWIFIATYLGLPVSTTHSTVGGTIGVAIAARGWSAVSWKEVGKIASSWVISPAISAIVGVTVFAAVRHLILRKPCNQAIQRSFRFFPGLVVIVLAVNIYFIIYEGIPSINTSNLKIWQGVLISIAIGILFGGIGAYFAIPALKRLLESWTEDVANEHPTGTLLQSQDNSYDPEIAFESLDGAEKKDPHKIPVSTKEESDVHAGIENDETVKNLHDRAEKFDPKVEYLFGYLQVMTACFASFAHGANDTSNAIGPFVAVYTTYVYETVENSAKVPPWILAAAGVGIVLGLAILGYRIITSIGVNLTKITPARGFAMEFAGAIVVVIASQLGLPISTTHCQVGAILGIGAVEGLDNLNLRLLIKITVSWVVTLVFAAVVSALVLYGFSAITSVSL